MTNNKIYSLLGLAQRAGKISSGEFMTEQSVKAGKAVLIIVAEDASANTKKNFTDMSAYYKVPIIIFGSKSELGHALGKEIRASLALTDSGFAGTIQKQLLNTSNQQEVLK